jgi:hypothetical protein
VLANSARQLAVGSFGPPPLIGQLGGHAAAANPGQARTTANANAWRAFMCAEQANSVAERQFPLSPGAGPLNPADGR